MGFFTDHRISFFNEPADALIRVLESSEKKWGSPKGSTVSVVSLINSTLSSLFNSCFRKIKGLHLATQMFESYFIM
jgi:hypothetical protein